MSSRPVQLVTLGVAVVSFLYMVVVRPWFTRWGASGTEVSRMYPGDALIPQPRYESVRAITIHAPPSEVWPWLVQMGQGRGGLYSYDWLENLVGLDFHSADTIIPELQDLELGDYICLAPEDQMPLAVTVFEPHRALVLRTGLADAPQPPGNYMRGEIAASWAFILDPVDEHQTRLIVRWRSDWTPGLMADMLNAVMLEPVHFIMEQAMMRGIKQRAEQVSFALSLSSENGVSAHVTAAVGDSGVVE
jgi:hypothetical protein